MIILAKALCVYVFIFSKIQKNLLTRIFDQRVSSQIKNMEWHFDE